MATNLQFIKQASGTSVSTLSITDCFNAKYDVYQVFISKVDITGLEWVEFQYLDTSGNALTGTVYDEAVQEMLAYGSFSEGRSTGRDEHGRLARFNAESYQGVGVTFTVFNPYSSNYTFAKSQSSAMTSSGLFGSKGIFVYKADDVVAGLKFKLDTQTFDNITVNVYGIKG